MHTLGLNIRLYLAEDRIPDKGFEIGFVKYSWILEFPSDMIMIQLVVASATVLSQVHECYFFLLIHTPVGFKKYSPDSIWWFRIM